MDRNVVQIVQTATPANCGKRLVAMRPGASVCERVGWLGCEPCSSAPRHTVEKSVARSRIHENPPGKPVPPPYPAKGL